VVRRSRANAGGAPGSGADLDAELRDRLRDLGYIR